MATPNLTSTPPGRRSKTMPTDGPTCKFLYTIMKQLDLKSIDWNLVAAQLDISNGHAARMRYSRFKQQMQIMEGITPTPKHNRPRKPGPSKAKTGSTKTDHQSLKHSGSLSPVFPKQEPGFDAGGGCGDGFSAYDDYPFIKHEPCVMHEYSGYPPDTFAPSTTSVSAGMMTGHAQGGGVVPGSGSGSNSMVQYPPVTTVAPTDLSLRDSMGGFYSAFGYDDHQGGFEGGWAPVKMERGGDGCFGDVLVKVEQ